MAELSIIIRAKDLTKNVVQGAQTRFQKLGNAVSQISLTQVAALSGLAYGLKKTIDAFAQEEQAQKALETALGYTSKALLDHASAMQKVTLYGDEEVVQAQALIGSFIKEEDAIKRATQAAMDLATAKKMDLKAAADLVSKTLGSTTNALTRYGIEVEGAVGSSERLESLTTNLAKVFGGQAQAAAQTMSGRLKQMSNALSDVQEQIGGIVLEALMPLIELIKSGAEWFQKLPEPIKQTGVAFGVLATAIKVLHISLGPTGWLIVGLTALAPVISSVIDKFRIGTRDVAAFRQEVESLSKAVLQSRLDQIKIQIQETMAEIKSGVWEGFVNGMAVALGKYDMIGSANEQLIEKLEVLSEKEKVINEILNERTEVVDNLHNQIIENIEEEGQKFATDFVATSVDGIKQLEVQHKNTALKQQKFIGGVGDAAKENDKDMAKSFSINFVNPVDIMWGSIVNKWVGEANDNFTKLWRSMVASFFDAVAQMTARWLTFKALSSFFPGFGLFSRGGIVSGIKKAQTGMISGFDTVPILARRGEAIIPAETTRSNMPVVRQLIAGQKPAVQASGGGKSVTINNYISTIDEKGVRDFIRSQEFRSELTDAFNDREIRLEVDGVNVTGVR